MSQVTLCGGLSKMEKLYTGMGGGMAVEDLFPEFMEEADRLKEDKRPPNHKKDLQYAHCATRRDSCYDLYGKKSNIMEFAVAIRSILRGGRKSTVKKPSDAKKVFADGFYMEKRISPTTIIRKPIWICPAAA